MTPPRTVESIGEDTLWLESTAVADRYQTGVDAYGDSQSAWFCRQCGTEVEDVSKGCEHCGFGLEE